jgi:hypothetical protein
MNGNIGKNIKALAQTCGWICLFAGIIAAVIMWSTGWGFEEGLYVFGGGLALFLSAWPLYGFGQLIEDVSAIRKNTELKRINGQPTGNANMFNDLPDL